MVMLGSLEPGTSESWATGVPSAHAWRWRAR